MQSDPILISVEVATHGSRRGLMMDGIYESAMEDAETCRVVNCSQEQLFAHHPCWHLLLGPLLSEEGGKLFQLRTVHIYQYIHPVGGPDRLQ